MPTSSAETVVVVPVLNRPRNVAPLMDSLAKATPEKYRLVFVATAGDGEEITTLQAVGAEWLEVPPEGPGEYARKINYAFKHTTEPFLFTGADDLRFHDGWLTRALERMADPKVGVVGTNDLGNERVIAGEHSTHSLVRRTYIDRFGTIDEPGKVLHEQYWHEFVDDELVGTAIARDAFVWAGDSIVEHLHPLWGKAQSDSLYEGVQLRMRKSRALFRQRQRLWESPTWPM